MDERVFASKFLARTQSLVTQIMVALRVNDDDGLAAQNGLRNQKVKAARLAGARCADDERMAFGVRQRLEDVLFSVAQTVNPGKALRLQRLLALHIASMRREGMLDAQAEVLLDESPLIDGAERVLGEFRPVRLQDVDGELRMRRPPGEALAEPHLSLMVGPSKDVSQVFERMTGNGRTRQMQMALEKLGGRDSAIESVECEPAGNPVDRTGRKIAELRIGFITQRTEQGGRRRRQFKVFA